MHNQERDAGFTLIETLVALVIFVTCYLVIHQSVSLGWRGVQVAHSEAGAVRLAQGLLTAAGVDSPLQEGQQTGTTQDGYTWSVLVRRYAQPDAGDVAVALKGYWVNAEVNWPEGPLRKRRSLQLSTLKLKAGS